MIKGRVCALAFLSLTAMLLSGPQQVRAQQSEKKEAAEKVQTESSDRRATAEPRITRTFYLPNFSQAIELQDVVNALRTTDEVRRIYHIASASTILVSGTPDQLASAEKIIADLDKAKARSGGNYRVDFRITELESGKKINSRSYGLIVGPRAPGKVRATARVPASANSEAGSENKQLQFLDVGNSIDCTVRSAHESSVVLSVDMDVSTSFGGESPQLQPNSTVRQFKSASQVELELGKPTVIDTFDDPISKRTLQIEITANRVQPRS